MLPQNIPAMASLVLKQETLKDRAKVLECLAVKLRQACVEAWGDLFKLPEPLLVGERQRRGQASR